MNLTTKDLLALNAKGLFPFPGESKKSFCSRLTRVLKKKAQAPSASHSKALLLCQELFDISPDWIEIQSEQEQLLPWQVGLSIWDSQEQSLSLHIKDSPFCSAEEVIAHELIHIPRMPFKEDAFDEIFAYKSSSSSFRRYWAPLSKYIGNGKLFFMSCLFFILSDILSIMYLPSLWMWIQALKGGCLCLGLFFAFRLHSLHQKLKHCCQQLEPFLKEKARSLAFAYRLSQEEIYLFAKASPSSIREYIESQKELRWQIIRQIYLR